MSAVAVVGATTWGTTLAIITARKGVPVRILVRNKAEADALRKAGEHTKFLSGQPFPPSLTVTHDAKEALRDASLVLVAVPSKTFRTNIRAIANALTSGQVVLSATKGLEVDTGRSMSQVLAEELPKSIAASVCVLSGPNLAKEIVREQPASTVVASRDTKAAELARDLLMSPRFRVYTSDDVIGVELGGALKNVVALGAGIGDGMQVGDNAKAAFVTRGLAEITRLGVAAGANPLTFAGLAGLGDLVATCASPLSRNRYVGEQLAKGRKLADIQSTMTNVAEGVDTTVAALRLASKLKVEMPIAQAMHRVLFEGLDVTAAMDELMGRPPRREWEGVERAPKR